MNFFKNVDFNFRSVKTVEDVLNFINLIPKIGEYRLEEEEQGVEFTSAIKFKFDIRGISFCNPAITSEDIDRDGRINSLGFIKKSLILPKFFATTTFELNKMNISLFREYFNSSTIHKNQVITMNDQFYPYLGYKDIAILVLSEIVPCHIFSPTCESCFTTESIPNVYNVIRTNCEHFGYGFDISTEVSKKWDQFGDKRKPKEIKVEYMHSVPSKISLIV